MSDTPIFELGGPDEDWYLQTVVGLIEIRGRFIIDTLGHPIWFQATDGRVYFMSHIISVARLEPRKRGPYAEELPTM